MNYVKEEARELVDRLYNGNRLNTDEHLTLRNGIDEIELLRDRDEVLEELWGKFADIPMNPETECIEEPFMGWGAGIHREEIWHWFDRRHSKGVAYLLYGDGSGVTRTPEAAKLLYLKQLCMECESQTCQYNHGGECRFALVHERKPRINDVDGCIDYDYQEGEC
jgi:hypothetical protein